MSPRVGSPDQERGLRPGGFLVARNFIRATVGSSTKNTSESGVGCVLGGSLSCNDGAFDVSVTEHSEHSCLVLGLVAIDNVIRSI